MAGYRMRALRRGATAVLLVAACGAAGFFGTDYVRHHRYDGQTLQGIPIPRAVEDAGNAPTATPPKAADPATAAAIAQRLGPLVANENLGARVRAVVLDPRTGDVLYSHGATALTTPASTAKILTATALLAVRKPTDTITTKVVRGATSGTVVLVGGGDPTLSAAAAAKAPEYPGAARIADLAAQLRKRNIPINRIVVDESLFAGPKVSPRWSPDDVPTDYASPITAAMVDGGRTNPGDLVRSDVPDIAAGQALAAALDVPTVVAIGHAPAHAAVLASVRSAPFSTLVEQMLEASDNVIAECLARQVALAKRLPASFTGAASAVRSVLKGLGVDPGAGLYDGSGLAQSDRVSVQVLARVLALDVTDTTRGLTAVINALPVAAWSGTLVDRYRAAADRAAAGLVRAKTGTLTEVNALAGVVHTRTNGMLVFAVVADRVAGYLTTFPEDALDAIAASLAQCGC